MIKSILKSTLSATTDIASLDILIKISGQKTILPFYHTVSDFDLWHIKNLYPIVDTKQFNADLDFLQKNYTEIDSNYLITNGISKNKRTFFLSFDDGLREFHDVVAPILIKRGIPATCFINPAFVDNKDMFYRLKVSVIVEKIKKNPLTSSQLNHVKKTLFKYGIIYHSELDFLKITDHNKLVVEEIAVFLGVNFNEYLLEHKPYLTTEQIKNLIKQGFTFGSHSYTHPSYHTINEDVQIAETISSIEWIKDRFSIKDKLFAFPYTDFKIRKSFFEQIENQVDLSFGTANLKLDSVSTNLQRIPMEINGRTSAEKLIKSEYIYFILKKMLGRHIIKRD